MGNAVVLVWNMMLATEWDLLVGFDENGGKKYELLTK